MKRYTYKQLVSKIIKIIKMYIKSKKSDQLRVLLDIESKYRLRTFFWEEILSEKYKVVLKAVMNHILSRSEIVKTLNYYFEHMGKNDTVKHYTILEYVAIAYRSIVPTMKGYPRLYRHRRK